MKIGGEIKLLQDEYAGFYSCGLTMSGSSTMSRFSHVYEDESVKRMETEDGLILEIGKCINPVTKTIQVSTTFTNNSDREVTLELLTSFVLEEIEADTIHRILSFWSSEGRLKTDTVTQLNMEMSWNRMAYRVEKFGNVGSMPVRKYFPFLALENSKTGEVTAVSLYSPASWQMEIICRHDETLTVNGGIADRDFGHFTATVRPGESIEAPKAVIAVGKSLEDVCDMLVKSQKPDISCVDENMGIAFNEYCATWGNPNENTIKQVCDKIAGKGIKYLVMDSGWYGADDGYWWDFLGDWSINRNRFPNGLKPVADYIKSKGMIPGIWFEFESVAHRCELYNCGEHLVKKDGVPLTVGGRRFLDMEDEWVWDYLNKNVTDLLRDAGYGYIKIDYNDTMGIGCDGPDGMGENLRKKVLATQRFFKSLKQSIPKLVIENCSSGGHRLEPSMMELSSMASFSDAHEIKAIPLIAANLLRVIRADQNQIWAVMRKDDSDERIYYSLCATMLGRMGLSGDIYDISPHGWQLIEEGMAFYKKISAIIKYGKVTCIKTDCESYNEPKGGQLVIKEFENNRLYIYHRFSDSTALDEFCGKYKICCPTENEISLSYGRSDKDFSAVALLTGGI